MFFRHSKYTHQQKCSSMLHEIYRAFLEARISMTTRLLTTNYCITHDRCDSYVVCTYVHMCKSRCDIRVMHDGTMYVRTCMRICMNVRKRFARGLLIMNSLAPTARWTMLDSIAGRMVHVIAHVRVPSHIGLHRCIRFAWGRSTAVGKHLTDLGRICADIETDESFATMTNATHCDVEILCVCVSAHVCVRFGNKIAVCYVRCCRTWNPKFQIPYNVGMKPSNFWV